MTRPVRRALIASAIVVGLAAGLVACVFLAPAPAGLVNRLAVSNADWLLSTRPHSDSRVSAAYRKLLGSYIQYGLAREVRAALPAVSPDSDVKRVAVALSGLRASMLNQSEVVHAPVAWAPILSGVGYCDQLNAMAANVLGGQFEHSQIVALADPVTKAEHTVGRVWSREFNDWLYFDLWAKVAVFRVAQDGHVRILYSEKPYAGAADSNILAMLDRIYAFAPNGHPFNEYPSSFGAFVLQRLAQRQTTVAASPANPAKEIGPPVPTPTKRDLVPESDPATRRQFAQAQITQLFGDRRAAAREFQAIADHDSVTILGRAAAVFATRAK